MVLMCCWNGEDTYGADFKTLLGQMVGGGGKINLATKLCGKVYQIFNAENGFLADFTSSSLTSQAFVSFCYVL